MAIKKPNWRATTIYWDVMAAFKLTHAEYCVLDFIRVMQGSPKSPTPGWCTYPASVIAESLRLSIRSVRYATQRMQEAQLLVCENESRQVSKDFFDAVAMCAHGDGIGGANFAGVQKLHRKGAKTAPQGVQNLHHRGAKTAPTYNGIDKERLSNLDKERISSASADDAVEFEEIKQTPAPQSRRPKNPQATDTTRVNGKGNLANAKKAATEQTAAELLEILNDLTQRTGRGRFQPVKGTLAPIVARLNEGYAADDIQLVFQHKTLKWLGDQKARAWLNPTTLCGLQKFPQYLADAHRDQALVQTGDYFKTQKEISNHVATATAINKIRAGQHRDLPF